jgi:Flp pilus assembly protein TadG
MFGSIRFGVRMMTRQNSCRGRLVRRQGGQALIELAILLPFLLVLALGLIEVGRYAYISILVGNAARAGAAYGARGLIQAGDQTGISTAAYNDFAGTATTGSGNTNGLDPSTLTVSSFDTCGCDIGGTVSVETQALCNPAPGSSPPSCSGHWIITVHVTAGGTYQSLFHYPGIPGSLSVSDTATMRVATNPE